MFQALVPIFRLMKTNVKAILPLVIGLMVLFFASCKTKNDIDLGKRPMLSLKEAPGYISKSDTVKMNELVKVGVIVDNEGAADKLNKFYVLKVNGENDYTVVKEVIVSEEEAWSFSEEVKFTFTSAGARSYKFIINNTHGVESEKVITFTVVE
jgi:hypothetical protein